MGRVFFPTYRANVIGVREVGPQTQLGGMDGAIVVPRAPAEPYPRAANNPTGRMLGAVAVTPDLLQYPVYRGIIGPIRVPLPTIYRPPASPPPSPLYLAPGATGVPAPAQPAAPVSAQSSPTPVVIVPPQRQSPGSPILVSSGGGTAAPATQPITIQTGDTATGAITAWLQGSTSLFNFNVPNALLAFAAVLGFAFLSGGSGKKR